MAGIDGYQQVSRSGLGGLFEQLGDRARRRAEPRLGIALAGVGMLMVLAGILAWAGERAGGEGDTSAKGDTTLGILLSLGVVVAGYAILVLFRRGPLATAGVVASALGVPVLLGFATFDPSLVSDTEAFLPLPFEIDAIVLLSLLAWLVSFGWVPAARGRAFYLAASSVTLWLYALEKAEEGAAGYVLTLPFSLLYFSFDIDGDSQIPNATTIGWWSLAFGVAYYALAVVLDRQGHRGSATPFAAVGLVTTALGLAHLAGDLEAIGVGILLIVLGAALAFYGATRGRRLTTWVWSLGIGLGVLLIVGDIFENTVAGFGVTAIVLGAAVVGAAQLFTDRFAEPDEMLPGPSGFTPRRPNPPPPPVWPGYPPPTEVAPLAPPPPPPPG